MKWFKNLKISVKLISTFVIIALIAGGVGTYGIISLSNANASSSNLFRNYGNSQGYLGYVLGEFQKQRALMRDILVDKDATKAAATNESIKASDETMMKYMDLYAPTCETAEEVAAYKDLSTKMQNFRDMVDKVVAAGLAGKFDEAYDIGHTTESAAIVQDATKALNDAVAENMTSGDILLKAQESASGTTIVIMIALVVMAVVLAILLGIFLSKMISKPIIHLSQWARRLAAGDPTLVKTSFSQKDEIGEIYESVRAILDAVKRLVTDADMLTESAINGDLSVRADATQHEGYYRQIVEGVNGTLDAIVGPIKEAMEIMGEMSHGSLEHTIKGDYKGDFASFKEALNNTVGKLKQIVGEISYTLGEMSKGNLDVEITSEYNNNFTTVKESINGIAAALNDTMMEIRTAADQVLSGARQVSDGNQAVSQGATEQASSIEELTATITQIAQQTKQNAMSANNANELTVSAVNDAAQGNEQMKAMQQAMSEISESSQNIGKIIKVIDDIAFQTNILALNAAVEAARAGVHGKGFAVVAEEVRNLAARSANAAKETTDLIEGSIRKTEAGTKIADETAGALSSIVEGVDKAAQLVSEIARASNEQAGAIAQVNNGIEQMSQVVQTNSATAEEGAAASEELSSQSELLKSMVGKFRLKAGSEQWKTPEPAIAAQKSAVKSKTPVINMSDGDFGKY